MKVEQIWQYVSVYSHAETCSSGNFEFNLSKYQKQSGLKASYYEGIFVGHTSIFGQNLLAFCPNWQQCILQQEYLPEVQGRAEIQRLRASMLRAVHMGLHICIP